MKEDLISQAPYDTIYSERYSESNSDCPQLNENKKKFSILNFGRCQDAISFYRYHGRNGYQGMLR